jgi:hypothetical protein
MTDTVPVAPLPPGVYDQLPAEEYHADPSLSASGMKLLLDPGCPALYRYERDHPQPPKATFDFGHAAHRLVLGDGAKLRVLDYDDYKTKDARQARDDARAEGCVPMLPHDMDKAWAMAAVVRAHPVAGALFRGGRPEVSLFFKDPTTGVPLRARLDWLDDQRKGRAVLTDYKTIGTGVDLDHIERAIYDYGYHCSGAQYSEAVQALDLAGDDAVTTLVFQSKDPPFLVRVVQLPFDALKVGRAKRRAAINLFKECSDSGVWSGYDDVAYAGLPPWAQAREEMEYLT